MAPRKASAQIPVTDIAGQAQTVKKTVFELITEGVVSGLFGAANYFFTKLAADFAQKIVEGCPGQKPCWDSFFIESVKNAADGAAGELIEGIADQSGLTDLAKSVGIDLCAPPDPNIMLNIQLGLFDDIKPKEPKCSFTTLKKNYEAFGNKLMNTEELMKGMKVQFDPGNAPLSVSLGVLDGAMTAKLKAEADAKLKILADAGTEGFSAVTDVVSRRVTSPGAEVKATFDNTKKLENESSMDYMQRAMSGQIVANQFISMGLNVVQTFVITLANALLKKLAQGLLPTSALVELQPGIIFSEFGIVQPGGAGAEAVSQRQALLPPPQVIPSYEPLALFGACPQDGRSTWNCVIDNGFSTAVRLGAVQGMTVQQAIDDGFLQGNKPLIPPGAKNRDRFCYETGYCYSNLKKLRAARIIPIGWEIAASMSNETTPVTLQQVIEGFDNCPRPGEPLSDDKKWCHLIDPDWVLKVPPTQCRNLAYGNQLVGGGLSERIQTCVDAPTCIEEDGRGNCLGNFGYCLEEKNVWRFSGDSCPAQFNSCRTVKPTTGGSSLSVLFNTIEHGVCNASNAGCRAYSTELNADPELGGQSADASDDWLLRSQRFLTRDAETCTVDDGGCTELMKFGEGQSLNLVRNGGFEDLDDADNNGEFDRPTGWDWPRGFAPGGRAGHVDSTGDQATSGRSAIFLNGTSTAYECSISTACTSANGCTCEISGTSSWHDGMTCLVPLGRSSCDYAARVVQSDIAVRPGSLHTLSASFRARDAGDNASGTARLQFLTADGSSVSVTTSGANGASVSGVNGDCRVENGGIALQVSGVPEVRASCAFIITQTPDQEPIVSAVLSLEGLRTYADEVQLEQGVLTDFHEGYGGATEKAFAKVAPKYIGCTGEPGEPAECEGYARICRETELGCELYTPDLGDPAVPAIVGSNDRCPAECVGYESFIPEPTQFESGNIQPAYFIPANATACSAQDVGCSQFTNINDESISYFSEIRKCEPPGDDVNEVFYTWEGTDTAGYQLKVWNLKRTEGTLSDSSTDDAVSGTNAGFAPCIKLNPNNINLCIDTVSGCNVISDSTRRAVCQAEVPANACTAQDIADGDLDCREFYDSDGNRHYRRMSHTIIKVAECDEFRITTSTSGDCLNTGGTWQTTEQRCIYNIAPSESRACPAAANNCRSYKGNASSNVVTLLTDDFESGLGDLAQYNDGLAWKAFGGDISQSTESLSAGGHSMKIGGSGKLVRRDVTNSMIVGKRYTLSFWARGSGRLGIKFYNANPAMEQFSYNDSDVATPTVELISGWRKYTLGPVTLSLSGGATEPSAVQLEFAASAPNGTDVFIDNVQLVRAQDNITVVRGSWFTPASCDQQLDGTPVLHAMLGCRAYRDSKGVPATLRSFSRLCREQSIGCTAYSDLKNTPETAYAQTFNEVCRLATACSGASVVGVSCPCDYTVAQDAFDDAPRVVTDVCRVPIGSTTCRFTFDGRGTTFTNEEYPDRAVIEADERRYLVVNGTNTCSPASASCTVMGQPNKAYELSCKLNDTCNPGQRTCVLRDGEGEETTCTAAGGADCDCTELVGSTNVIRCSVANGASTCTYAVAGEDVDGEVCSCSENESGSSVKRCDVRRGSSSCVYPYDQGAINRWDAVALKDDPSKYQDSLCTVEAVGCEAYTSFGGGEVYFKDPGAHTCVFKESVNINGQLRSGWFRKSEAGGIFPCYPELLRNGVQYEIYKNADESCHLEETCTDPDGCLCPNSSEPVCVVTEGRSSCGFDGWVGVCEGKYDRCEEFLDPMDSTDTNPEGRPYYFLENAKLDYDTCGSSVSLKHGCALLKKTSDTRDIYNAAATYRLSDDSANDAVPAVDCTVDYDDADPRCKSRCTGLKNAICLKSGSQIVNSSRRECYSNADCDAGEACTGDRVFGLACTSDDDCNVVLGEECRLLDREQVVNDTNVIVKVRADRQCRSWLQCKSSQSEFEPNTGEWIDVCTAFGECDEMKRVGNSTECAHWVDRHVKDPATDETRLKRLTTDIYKSRDITWWGKDYSGYSLIGQYPMQNFIPVSITKGKCVRSGNPLSELPDPQNLSLPLPCVTSDDCSAVSHDTNYYCLDVKGICIGGNEEGRPCEPTVSPAKNTASDCPSSAFCSTSLTSTQRYGVEVFPGSECGDDNPPCPADITGGNPGSCYDSRCIYDASGGPLTGSSGTPSCRAYPEKDAPFSYLVTTDEKPVYADQVGHLPTRIKADFKDTNICVEGNECECAYTREVFGKLTKDARFYSLNAPRNNEIASGKPVGVCVGGQDEGKLCSPSASNKTGNPPVLKTAAPGTTETTAYCRGDDGRCQVRTSIVQALGQYGFCVDHDEGLNIEGTRATYDCISWLPVDKLQGQPNLFNRFKEAGFRSPVPELQYCVAARGNEVKLDNGSYGYDRVIYSDFGGNSSVPDNYLLAVGEGNVILQDNLISAGGYTVDAGAILAAAGACGVFGGPLGALTCGGIAAILSLLDTHSGRRVQVPIAPAGMVYQENDITAISVELGGGTDRDYPNDDTNPTSGDRPRIVLRPPTWEVAVNYNDHNPDWPHMDWSTPQYDYGGHTDYPGIGSGKPDCNWIFRQIWTDDDALENYCSSIADRGSNDGQCIGLKAVFDEHGYLLGLTGAMCYDFDTLQFNREEDIKVHILTREECTDYAHVYRSDDSWTSVVFTEQMRQAEEVDHEYDFGGGFVVPWETDSGVTDLLPGLADATVLPLGAGVPGQNVPQNNRADLPSSVYSGISPRIPVVGSYGGPFSYTIRHTSTGDGKYGYTGGIQDAGIPYACQGKCPEPFGPVSNSLPEISFPSGFGLEAFVAIQKSNPSVARTQGQTRLQQLFAVAWQTQSYATPTCRAQHGSNVSGTIYDTSCITNNPPASQVRPDAGPLVTGDETNTYGWDVRVAHMSVADVPMVKEYVKTNGFCRDENCKEGGPGITVNGYTAHDPAATTTTFTGSGGRYDAIIRYYAYANQEHMPLRWKVFDFGDGSPAVESGESWYKNHRGLQVVGTGPGATSEEICGNETAGFNSKSCVTQVFEERTTYVCSAELLTLLPACDSGKVYPCQQSGACRFKPRVMVMDNWGVCNGTCTDAAGLGGAICMNEVLGYVTEVTPQGQAGQFNECALELLNKRDNYGTLNLTRPWTAFDADIIVPL